VLTRAREFHRRHTVAVVIAYLVAAVGIFMLLNARLSIEWVILLLIGAAFLFRRGKIFLRDWGVFIAVVIAWQLTDGLATDFNFPWHVQDLITADKKLFFGTLPTLWLQRRLFHPGYVSWYDLIAVTVYSLHFLLPLGAGFLLWLLNRQLYYKYAICFVIAAVLGFATYIVFPAVPPWLAAQYATNCDLNAACWIWRGPVLSGFGLRTVPANPHPYLPMVYDVWNHTMRMWITKNHGNFAFSGFTLGYDQVGAMPSEHVMYPTLVLLFFRRQFGRLGNLMILYIMLVIFSIVYMGQHWVVDALAGIVYAVVVYVSVMHVFPWVRSRLAHRRVATAVLPEPQTELRPKAADERLPVTSGAESAR